MATNEALINFSTADFTELYERYGEKELAKIIAETAKDRLPDEDFSYETLQSGTAPFLATLSGLKDLDVDGRKRSDEAILAMFTNAEDYGKYTTPESSGWKAFGSGFGRAAPESIAGGLGFSGGVKAVSPIAAAVPPIGLPGLFAKGAILFGGGLTGSILAAFAADEAEEAVIGEEKFILPSLRPAKYAGEGTMYGLSMLHAPWSLASNKMSKASQFLQNYKDVASGKFAAQVDKASELTAKNAGLSQKAYQSALDAQKAVQDKGLMFNMGFGRFNPKGKFVDPRKGPLGERISESVSTGTQASLKWARENPKTFVGYESAASIGAGGLTWVSETHAPGEEGWRFAAEIVGAGVVPLFVEAGIPAIKGIKDSLVSVANRYLRGEDTEGLLTSRLNKEGAERLYRALQISEEFKQSDNPELALETLIEGLMADYPDLKGEMTTATLAEAVGLPMSKALENIETTLAKSSEDLQVAGSKGRERIRENAKLVIILAAGSGNPQAVQAVARIQQALYEESILTNVDNALSKFYESAERVLKDQPVDADGRIRPSLRTDLSKQLSKILDDQIAASKKLENELWEDVGEFPITEFRTKDGQVIARPNILELLDTPAHEGGLKFASGTGKSAFNQAKPAGFGEDIQEFRDYFNPPDGADAPENPVMLQKLIEMRRAAQDRAAELRSAGSKQKAKYMDKVADALLQDMNGLGNTGDSAYNAARAYSYARNNVFTRSFLGDLQVYDKNRDLRISPELMARELFRGGNDVTALRLKEISTAVKFGIDHGLDPKVFDQLSTQEVMDLLVHDSLRKFIKPMTVSEIRKLESMLPEGKELRPEQTFKVDAAALERWRREPGTQELFTIFPGLDADTRAPENAQRLYEGAVSDLIQNGASPQTRSFQAILQYQERPAKAVADAINSEKPFSALRELFDLVDRSPDNIVDPIDGQVFTKADAIAGLRTAILDYGVSYSGGSGLGFNPTAFYDKLFGRLKGADATQDFTLAKFMEQNGIMDADELEKLKKAIAQMRQVDEAFATGQLETVLFKNPTPAKMLQARILGATFGVKAQQELNNLLKQIGLGTTGSPIGGGMIAAEAGSEAVTKLLLMGPESQRQKILVQLFSNPKALGEALKDVKKSEDAKNAFSAIEKAFAIAAKRTGRRLPYVERVVYDEITDEEESEPLFKRMTEEEREAFERVPFPSEKLEERRRSFVPPPVSAVTPPTPVTAPAPSPPNLLVSAPLQPRPAIASAPQAPTARARYAALFPYDSTSALIRQQSANQGIGSLAG